MNKPEMIASNDNAKVVGYIFDAPLVIKNWSWIPMAQFMAWLMLSREAVRKNPEWSWWKRFGIGGLKMSVILGSEWCHNLAHAAAAKWIGKPVDEIRVVLGMPLLVYHDVEDRTVTPRQHIFRALGGPIVNIFLLAGTDYLKRFTKADTSACEVVDASHGVNLILLVAGLMPQPGLDGGAMLKWILVSKGLTPKEADKTVRCSNYAAAAGLAGAAVAASKKSKKAWSMLFGGLAALSLAVATGLLREKA